MPGATCVGTPRAETGILSRLPSTGLALRETHSAQNIVAVGGIARPTRIASRFNAATICAIRDNAMSLKTGAFASEHDISGPEGRRVNRGHGQKFAARQVGLHTGALGAESYRRADAQNRRESCRSSFSELFTEQNLHGSIVGYKKEIETRNVGGDLAEKFQIE